MRSGWNKSHREEKDYGRDYQCLVHSACSHCVERRHRRLQESATTLSDSGLPLLPESCPCEGKLLSTLWESSQLDYYLTYIAFDKGKAQFPAFDQSDRITAAALCPGAPVTSPPGCVPAPQR